MAGEWLDTTLGDVLTLQRGFDLPESERRPGACPVIASTGPVGTHDQAMVKGPGVVIGRSGSLGGGQFIEGDFWPLNTTLWVKDFKGNDRRFCYYLLKSLDLAHFNAGSGVPTLNRNHIHPLPVTIPKSPAEQRAIAHILGTLDDKIELNRRMSETLEAMARALFKAWFVDFEPVRAKMEGRDPGLPAHLADLFPSRLVESELGEIPEGWEIGSFGSFMSQRTERVGSQKVVILSAVASGNLVRSDNHFTKQVYSKETHNYLLVEQWDFAYNPSRINIGSIGMMEEDLIGGVSPVYVVVRPQAAYRWFLKFSLQHPQTKAWINTLASGSVRQSLSYYDFSLIPCVLPPQQLLDEFNRRIPIFLDGIRAKEAECNTLAALRDTLLPKLISGELRVKDAETFLERVAA